MELISAIIYFSIAIIVGLAFFSLQYLEKINIFNPKDIDWGTDIRFFTIIVATLWPVSVVSCDLLENQYLRMIDKHLLKTGRTRTAGCDLLENQYLFMIDKHQPARLIDEVSKI